MDHQSEQVLAAVKTASRTLEEYIGEKLNATKPSTKNCLEDDVSPPYTTTATRGKLFLEEDTSFDLEFSLEGVPVNEDFVLRETEMDLMKEYFFRESAQQSRRLFTLHGLGGMGKTQLAVGFAYANKQSFSSIFFMNGTSRDTMRQSMSSALDRIWEVWQPGIGGRPSTKPDNAEEMIQTVLRWFDIKANDGWMIIYDNVDQEGPGSDMDLNCFIPKVDHGAIIVTTRLKPTSRKGHPYELGQMNDAQSSTLLDMNIDAKLPEYEVHSRPDSSAAALKGRRLPSSLHS